MMSCARGRDAAGNAYWHRCGAAFGFAALIFVGVPQPAMSSGFLNHIQSAGAASVSTAGQTAIAENAATIYYNSAGMTLLPRHDVLISTGFILPSNKFSNSGTTAPLGELSRGSVDIGEQPFLIPSMFASTLLSDRLRIGLGLFMPFGQIYEYANDWVGRYQVQSVSLTTIDIQPTFAYRVNDALSLGVGMDIQYTHLERQSAVDFGALCLSTLGPMACSAVELFPQSNDGAFAVDAEGWSVGFNVGVLYQLGAHTRVGINYRSPVSHDLAGDANFTVPAEAEPLTLSGGLFRDTIVRSKVTFPEVIAFGLYHEVDKALALLVDLSWTRWSRLDQVTLTFENPTQPTENLLFNWEDSFRIAVGGIYNITNKTHLHAGVSYDQSAVRDTYRGADLPDSDVMMYSVGINHDLDDRFSLLVSYSYSRYISAPVDRFVPSAGTLVGGFHRSTSALGMQIGFQF